MKIVNWLLANIEYLLGVAGFLGTVGAWAWLQILDRYKNAKWTARARKLTPLVINAWLWAEKQTGADAKTIAFAERLRDKFLTKFGAEPTEQDTDFIDEMKEKLCLAGKSKN
ncbi:MAG: hypothetical protein WC551_10560 [Patescibacteria group bacterium]